LEIVRWLSIATEFNDAKQFQGRIAPKSIEIDIEKLNMKYSALNVNLDSPSLDFLGSRKSAHEGIKEQYPRKSHYFAIVSQSFVKTVAAYHNKH